MFAGGTFAPTILILNTIHFCSIIVEIMDRARRPQQETQGRAIMSTGMKAAG
jgi:hypothetical protein